MRRRDSKRNRNNGPSLGHDSFLDIVANLVGILIILVVILGAAAKATVQPSAPEKTDLTATAAQMDELAEATMRAARAQVDSDRLEATIRRYDNELAQAERTRGQILDLIALAKQAWQEAQKDLDRDRVAKAAKQTELKRLEDRLADLEAQQKSITNRAAKVVEIDHLPTPMARTVFGEEVHLRLKANRVAIVPLNALVEAIKDDFKRGSAGSKMGLSESTVGPVQGFIARYVSEKSRGLVRRDGRAAMATQMQLVRLAVTPLRESIGTPLDQTLTGRSDLDVELAGRDPGLTTVTVWVYPDSFGSFRTLQKRLYQRGFATAARPLPEGMPITGSPGGSRSQAQ